MTFGMAVLSLIALFVLWKWLFGKPKTAESTITEGGEVHTAFVELGGVRLTVTPLWQMSRSLLWVECRLETWGREGQWIVSYPSLRSPLESDDPKRIYDIVSFSPSRGERRYRIRLKYIGRAGKRSLSVAVEALD